MSEHSVKPAFAGLITLRAAAMRLGLTVESLLVSNELPLVVQVRGEVSVVLLGPDGTAHHELMRKPDFLEISAGEREAIRADGRAVMRSSVVAYQYREYPRGHEYRRLPPQWGLSESKLFVGPTGSPPSKLGPWTAWGVERVCDEWFIGLDDLFVFDDCLTFFAAANLEKAARILDAFASTNASRALSTAAGLIANNQWSEYPTEKKVRVLLTRAGTTSKMAERAAKLFRPDSAPVGRPALKKAARHMQKVRDDQVRFSEDLERTLRGLSEAWGVPRLRAESRDLRLARRPISHIADYISPRNAER